MKNWRLLLQDWQNKIRYRKSRKPIFRSAGFLCNGRKRTVPYSFCRASQVGHCKKLQSFSQFFLDFFPGRIDKKREYMIQYIGYIW
ncbi:MAG TPA: hypothetical protein DEV98_02390 [Clostridiales bacterium]|nr:hypothetical protein [Clostridiales bacterium]